MSIHSVQVENYQSLQHVELQLGKFSCIVGPSSSGKSAFMRAMRTLTSNRRGSEWITHGAKSARISAELDSDTTRMPRTVTLTRSKSQSGENSYVLLYPKNGGANAETYTKLGGEVPAEVTKFLGIAAKDPINYAGQFDKPYLLDDSGSEIARTLGALTNVSVIFEAARESNRRKLNAAQQLKTRQLDLADITKKIPEYRQLKAQSSALQAAERLIEQARELERDISGISEALERLEASERAIATSQSEATRVLPRLDTAIEAHRALQAALRAIQAQVVASRDLVDAELALQHAEADLGTVEEDYDEALANLQDDLAGWIMATAAPDTQRTVDGEHYIRIFEATRVFTLYLETASKA